MIGKIHLLNKKENLDMSSINGEIIDIGRPNVLQNPFKMNSEEDREIIVREFYHYLREEYLKKAEVYNELIRISKILKSGKDVFLLCYCAPKLCHGNIIINAINGIISNG